MALSPQAQQKFEEVRTGLRQLYGVIDLSEEFNVSPAIQQRMEVDITESSSFLKAISTRGVSELGGQKIGLNFSGFIGKRTHTKAGHDRKAFDPHNMDQSDYFCNESEYDSQIDWLTADTWAKYKSFYKKWKVGITKQIALNRIQVGFWGQFTAIETANAGYSDDPNKYSMGQDFHEGFLQYIINWGGVDKVWGLKADGSIDPIRVGKGGDYENMEALIFDLKHSVLPRQYRKSPTNKVMVGDELYRAEVLRLYNSNGDQASEKKPLDLYIQQHTLGKLPVVDVPFFPEHCVLITPLRNFAHYHQIGSHRRSIEPNKHRKCIEDFNFMREDFVMEDLDRVAMVHPDAIQVRGDDGEWIGVSDEDKWAVEIPE